MKKLVNRFGDIALKNKNSKHFFASFLLLALGALLHFFMHSQISSYFGLEVYGYFSFFMAIIAFLFPISTLGFSASAVNILPTISDLKLRKEFVFLGLKITIVSVATLAISLVLLYVFGILEAYFKYLVFFVLFPLIALTRYFQQVFRGLKKSISSLLPEQILLPVVVLSAIYFLPSTLISLVVVMTAAWSIATVYSIVKIRKHVFFANSTKVQTRKWIKRSLLMIAGTLASIFLFRADVILVGFFMAPDNVGVYNACLKIAMLFVFPLGALNNIGISILAERFQQDRQSFVSYFDKLQLTSIGMMLLSCVILFALKDIFFNLFKIDTKYTYILYILVVGQVINGISGPVGYAMNIQNKEKTRLIIVTIACLVGVVSNLIFIPRYGLKGAAYTTAIIMIIQNTVMYYYARFRV